MKNSSLFGKKIDFHQGASMNHVDRFWDFFNPSLSLCRQFSFITQAYLVKQTFGEPPSPPALSTWFMEARLSDSRYANIFHCSALIFQILKKINLSDEVSHFFADRQLKFSVKKKLFISFCSLNVQFPTSFVLRDSCLC